MRSRRPKLLREAALHGLLSTLCPRGTFDLLNRRNVLWLLRQLPETVSLTSAGMVSVEFIPPSASQINEATKVTWISAEVAEQVLGVGGSFTSPRN
ncbi:hypothetical protein NDU88_006319 [Pleurodeles waltl]|uniref:Uncharacterized protein n=1 Tax=Pleurodeles waltl TaxID=8319 RepID=A0AAV7UKN3_PLEWA|nr:hypothetical protein NDU88_006319 [Pleurodeles waltl]